MKAAKAAKAASKAAKGASKVAKKAPPVPPHRIKDHIELAMEGLETITDLAGVAGDVAEAYNEGSGWQGEGAQHSGDGAQQYGDEETKESTSDEDNDVYSTKMTFDERFQEHEGAETIDVWKSLIKIIYELSLKCSYNAIMFVTGICVVIFWGFTFSCMSWLQIWCISPMSSSVIVVMKGCMPLILEPIRMFRGVCCGGGKKK